MINQFGKIILPIFEKHKLLRKQPLRQIATFPATKQLTVDDERRVKVNDLDFLTHSYDRTAIRVPSLAITPTTP